MKRTQIQLPDKLYREAHNVANRKEISLAELVRRGLEYMVAVSPIATDADAEWSLPKPRALNAHDPFKQENWRENIHTERLRAAEEKSTYNVSRKK